MKAEWKPVAACLLGLLVACHEHADDHTHADDHENGHTHEEGHEHANQADEGHGHAHGPEGHGVAIGITKWSSTLELFAEHPPAVAGERMPFLAHLTVLDGFQPLERGTVTLVLEGPTTLEAVADAPVRPGIFRPVVTPQRAGSYQARVEVRGPGVQGTVEGFSIEVFASHAEAEKASRQGPEDDGGAITLLKEQQWKVPFATAFAQMRSIVPSIEVAGEVTTPPDGRAQVGAPTAGRIVAPAAGLPRPGRQVRAGALLATIAPSPASPEGAARAQLAVAEARARLSAARAAVKRSKRLLEAQAIPEREHEEAQRELQVAQEALASARRAQRLYEGASSGRGGGSWRVKAPIRGTVVEVRATPGESVAAGQLLFRIVDRGELWLRAKVPEQRATGLRTDLNASYRITGSDTWRALRVSAEGANASIVQVDPTVDPDSRTVAVLYALHDPEPDLRIGGLVYLSLPIGEPAREVAVPRDAVLQRDGEHLVYVQVSGEAFEERSVDVGARAGSLAAIRAGIEPGERVVTRGAQVLRLAASGSAEAGHGHVH